jgi:hypothetical protein
MEHGQTLARMLENLVIQPGEEKDNRLRNERRCRDLYAARIVLQKAMHLREIERCVAPPWVAQMAKECPRNKCDTAQAGRALVYLLMMLGQA